MGISSYYFKNLEGRIIHNNYWDAHITSDNEGNCVNYATGIKNASNFNVVTDGLVLWLDVNNTGTTTNGDSLTSLVTWDEAIIKPCSGFTTCDFGLTGVDNGRYDMLSGITVSFTTADTKVILYPVTGYTVNDATSTGTKGKYDYPWTYLTGETTTKTQGSYCSPTTGTTTCEVGDVLCLNGGFYQGYFKLDFENPNPTEFTGTTNECGKEVPSIEYKEVPTDATKYDLMPTNFNIENSDCSTGTGGWSMETWVKWDNSNCYDAKRNALNDNFSANTGFFFYIGTRAENKFRNVFSGETGLYTCDDIIPLSPEGEEPEISGEGQTWFGISNYNFLNSSCCNICTGSTVTATTATTYCDELSENALGIRITPEGKIGYRKMTVDGFEYWCDDDGNEVDGCYLSENNPSTQTGSTNNCDSSDSGGNNSFTITGTTMEEGYSENPVVFSGSNWIHVVVTYNQTGVKHDLPSGTLKFWVNGRVVYKKEDFIGLQLRALNEYSSKQLGVPYNISWGGGSQGLLESQTFGGPDPNDQGLDIAKYFAGTFEGELSQLRFYKKTLNLLEIRNNFYIDSNRYCVRETYGGSLIVQPSLTDYCL